MAFMEALEQERPLDWIIMTMRMIPAVQQKNSCMQNRAKSRPRSQSRCTEWSALFYEERSLIAVGNPNELRFRKGTYVQAILVYYYNSSICHKFIM
jgi:hypothetical protein